ncbi:unnamed protein product [Clavelina lepadiformis]|uniref:Uncharacterized protein n=1 Tax=Clavelina lepadiformis TaxID=159417 RepID=A0ABP0GHG6_CLALP
MITGNLTASPRAYKTPENMYKPTNRKNLNFTFRISHTCYALNNEANAQNLRPGANGELCFNCRKPLQCVCLRKEPYSRDLLGKLIAGHNKIRKTSFKTVKRF